MNELKRQIVDTVLSRVQGPARYIGGELGSVVKEPADLSGQVCLAFPEPYELGMSHHGLQVLYSLANRQDDVWCQRAFLPEPDMAACLRERGLPLYGLEGFTPLARFDVVGFSLQYEATYTNVLEMLDLGGVPLRSADRTLADPLVIAGGPCAATPEPMADFIDVFVVGDGEPSLMPLVNAYLELRADEHGDGKVASDQRQRVLAALARRFPWAYVPSLYQPRYHADGRLAALEPLADGVPEHVEACCLEDLDGFPLPTHPLVPFIRTVHDRLTLEIMRGCPWRCRFCQASSMKRPLRYRRVDTIVQAALEGYRNTGFNEVSLLSLSTSDYPKFPELVDALARTLAPLGVSVSLPSLRVNEQLQQLPALVANVRKSGLTIAPEAAREDLRAVIGKNIRDADMFAGIETAYEQGWQGVKLYFMVGLPGERPNDLDCIVEMAHEASGLRRKIGKGRPGKVTASVSNLVPKPHSPLQWAPMATRDYLVAAHQRLRRRVRMRTVRLTTHNVDRSLLEAVLCRGDRRVGRAIETAWRNGATMDAWDEHFKPEVWQAAFRHVGLDPDWTCHRERAADEVLPWDHITMRRRRAQLVREYERSREQQAAMALENGR